MQRLGDEQVHELEVRRGPLRVRVSKDGAGAQQPSFEPAPSAPQGSVVVSGPDAPAGRTDYPTVTAPLTGIFYRSPSPQAAAFVQVGSSVAQGDVIGLIEAMKLFNEIRSNVSGKVRRILIENGQLVRAHQPIIELE